MSELELALAAAESTVADQKDSVIRAKAEVEADLAKAYRNNDENAFNKFKAELSKYS